MRLIIHVGHSKTGSSFIQSNLARNSEFLLEKGIFYPVLNDAEINPAISSGNGYLLINERLPVAPEKTHTYVLSSELIYGKMLSDKAMIDVLKDAFDQLGVSGAEFVVYVRDPIDHAESAYQQEVKRGGLTSSVEEFFSKYNMPSTVLKFCDRVSELEESTVSLINYSKHEKSAILPLLSCLGVSQLPDQSISEVRINRSLTASELFFQKAMNGSLGKSASFLSDALCNNLPDTKTDKVYPCEDVQSAMLARLKPDMDKVDEVLSDAEAYGRELRPVGPTPDIFGFDTDQTFLIASLLGAEIAQQKIDACIAKCRFYLGEARTTDTVEKRKKFAEMAETQIEKAKTLSVAGGDTAVQSSLIHQLDAKIRQFKQKGTQK